MPEYGGGVDPLVYLVTTVERLAQADLRVLTTDRNAVLRIATFYDQVAWLDWTIDWDLMRAGSWSDTQEEPDRKERRMAECLVHQVVPWDAFAEVHVRTEERRTEVAELLLSLGARIPVMVTPAWYF